MDERLRTIGIVERKYRSLAEDIGRTEARRMLRVPFYLRRPTHVTFNEKPGADSTDRHRRREVEWLTWHHLFRLPNERHDHFCGLLGAGRKTRERERSSHELEKTAASGL